MASIERILDWRGQDVFDRDGERLGKLDEVFYDRASGEAMLASIKSGLLGRRATLVSLRGATAGRDYVRLAFSAEQVGQTKDVEISETLSREALSQARGVYGLEVDDGAQLEAATLVERRRAEAEAAIARADDLEREAVRAADGARDARDRAEEASRAADAAERSAVELREEAVAARGAADAARQSAGLPASGGT